MDDYLTLVPFASEGKSKREEEEQEEQEEQEGQEVKRPRQIRTITPVSSVHGGVWGTYIGKMLDFESLWSLWKAMDKKGERVAAYQLKWKLLELAKKKSERYEQTPGQFAPVFKQSIWWDHPILFEVLMYLISDDEDPHEKELERLGLPHINYFEEAYDADFSRWFKCIQISYVTDRDDDGEPFGYLNAQTIFIPVWKEKWTHFYEVFYKYLDSLPKEPTPLDQAVDIIAPGVDISQFERSPYGVGTLEKESGPGYVFFRDNDVVIGFNEHFSMDFEDMLIAVRYSVMQESIPEEFKLMSKLRWYRTWFYAYYNPTLLNQPLWAIRQSRDSVKDWLFSTTPFGPEPRPEADGSGRNRKEPESK